MSSNIIDSIRVSPDLHGFLTIMITSNWHKLEKKGITPKTKIVKVFYNNRL